MPGDALLSTLEALWGIEGGLPVGGGLAWIERPLGFRVVEPRPQLPAGEGEWVVYLVRRVGLDSRVAGGLLAGLLGAERYTLQGLKDACAVAYQYVSLYKPRRTPATLEHARLKAWLIGRSRAPLKPGGHGFNIFSLDVRVDGDPIRLCGRLEGASWIPGYYGPQRFGVERPNTHYTGLLRLWGAHGLLLREYRGRYPLEPDRPPGRYEKAAARVVEGKASHLEASRPGPSRLQIEALQAYIFNKTLSRITRAGLALQHAAEHWVTLACPQGPIRAPAARLPSARILRARTRWAREMLRVMEEEGVHPRLWAVLPAKSAMRPLAFPVCNLKCKPQSGSGDARVCLTLPAGAYATVLLRQAMPVDWIAYSKCGAPVEQARRRGYG